MCVMTITRVVQSIHGNNFVGIYMMFINIWYRYELQYF